MIIGVDFDGTIVTHEYPDIGDPVPLALATMQELSEKGHQLILWTMRSDEYLDEAVKYVEQNGIKLFGVNKNPEQHTWTKSPKAYCQIYIDDAALGCPLTNYPGTGKRPFVNWVQIRQILTNIGIL